MNIFFPAYIQNYTIIELNLIYFSKNSIFEIYLFANFTFYFFCGLFKCVLVNNVTIFESISFHVHFLILSVKKLQIIDGTLKWKMDRML